MPRCCRITSQDGQQDREEVDNFNCSRILNVTRRIEMPVDWKTKAWVQHWCANKYDPKIKKLEDKIKKLEEKISGLKKTIKSKK